MSGKFKSHRHLVAWLDHHTARIFSLRRQDCETADKTVIEASDTGRGNIHHHAGTPGPGHNPVDQGFLEKISDAIGDANEILLVGPAEAKYALKSFLQIHRPHQALYVLGVEAMDQAGDAEIIAVARRFFARTDRIAIPNV